MGISTAEAVGLTAVSKTFGTCKANHNISLSIRKGSIHAIVGENGAGKSTLSKIIYGMYSPSSGELAINGNPVQFTSPRDAINAGIGMVHQHFMLIPTLSVAENIMLGNEQTPLFSFFSLKKAKKRIQQLSELYNIPINSDKPASSISVGEEQRVEIMKLLYRQADIMILDEPTAVLTPQETDGLFSSLRALVGKGKTVILITHKLDEVLDVADMVTVMKKGEVMASVPVPGMTKERLARMMVGRDVLFQPGNPKSTTGKPVLEIKKLGFTTAKGEQKLHELSLKVCSGEVYGIAGVEGNGQQELLAVLWGMQSEHTKLSGEVTLHGLRLSSRSPAQIAAMGVSYIPEDRLKHAVITAYTLSENLIFGRHREKIFRKNIGFNQEKISEYSTRMISEYDIRCDNPLHQSLESLSGGNQQKVVLSRELNRPGISLLVLAQPTRGVDIGAIEMIHKKIIDARQKGMAVLLVSSELEEIVALSTRIGCLYNGSIRREFTEEEVTRGRCCEHDFQKEIGISIT
ncbi:ABC transporter ATP-binding protein [Chlorobium phaeobacteroides]|uniref:Nucleoside ABC transporter ATP-binding protein n=1 Tax=Chlorobium phaeobacteroides (strain DSM 266 / SMG 266 / 2430) TaxID=290317 RepID=A1BF63_CHLPD|nr:ABC transporter ATP-binding protein [Chlorobium phaeobacteroides]ABL65040.1 nucleoside ABC transporter ATP-binding protein [Chlorobium phaeobacteroides DSM 266]